MLFDNAGNVVERYVYDPFGQATLLDAGWNVLTASAFGWLHLHQGGRLDATSGLYHFRHRDYSPTLGRWISLDPLRYDAGDVNLYRALGNGPVIWLDPCGLDRIDRTQAGNQTLLWYVDEKFIGSDKKFFVGVLVTINGEEFARRYVGGQPLYVPLAKVNSTTGFWESTPSNWDQWFRDNAASVNEPSLKNLQMQEGISRSNWNDLATGQKQIQGLAETAIYWNAGAGFNATPTAAANRAVAATQAPTTAREPHRIYSARELIRRAEEPGPFHNFPESFNAVIFRGNRQVISENYILYTQRGSINGVEGTFEIGVRPSASGRIEVITHRFFRPDPRR